MSSRKKILTCLLAACVVLTGGLAALSLVPHTHGNDLDHSRHESCPIHQLSLGHSVAVQASPALVWALTLVFLWLISSRATPFSDHRFTKSSGRAPPATL